ncbi:hypothetical protein TorRG33x02_101350 [Trema orientale]|uniref:Uncharacterized protein n=1 Tax=Trema orientale TaxID=63057 RepID=A0A2P5F8J6_TREOI|nr:hypothetical protein TorRG33x02_101350 [Trema orientale]
MSNSHFILNLLESRFKPMVISRDMIYRNRHPKGIWKVNPINLFSKFYRFHKFRQKGMALPSHPWPPKPSAKGGLDSRAEFILISRREDSCTKQKTTKDLDLRYSSSVKNVCCSLPIHGTIPWFLKFNPFGWQCGKMVTTRTARNIINVYLDYHNCLHVHQGGYFVVSFEMNPRRILYCQSPSHWSTSFS